MEDGVTDGQIVEKLKNGNPVDMDFIYKYAKTKEGFFKKNEKSITSFVKNNNAIFVIISIDTSKLKKKWQFF